MLRRTLQVAKLSLDTGEACLQRADRNLRLQRRDVHDRDLAGRQDRDGLGQQALPHLPHQLDTLGRDRIDAPRRPVTLALGFGLDEPFCLHA